MTNAQPLLLTGGMSIVIVTGNPLVIYAFMLVVSITCLTWTWSIVAGCKEKNRRLAVIASRAARREAHGSKSTTT